MDNIKNEIDVKFKNIEKLLKNELIGQDLYIKNLITYIKEKTVKNEKGVLILVGEKDTGKKTSIRILIEEMYKEKLIESDNINEINLDTYNFKLGYNAFLSDLHDKLKSKSKCIMFKNIQNAMEDIVHVISDLCFNSCFNLNEDYIIKNDVFVKADEENKEEINDILNSEEIHKEKINQLICNNKFVVFTCDYNDINLDKVFGSDLINKIDKVLYTKDLDKKERNIVVRRRVIETINHIKEELDLDIMIDLNKDDENKEYFGICKYLQESYKKDSNFGISEYVKYKLNNPLRNLVIKEEIKSNSRLFIYVENDEIYCKANSKVYKLNEYTTPTLEEARYKLNSIIGIKELKEFIDNVQNNYKVQNIRERLGLTTSKISMNMIFAGNAGTGKTNAARTTFEYLNALGLLSRGVFKEVSKADFVSENVNETAKKTMEVVNSAIGGVLFIDEAYSLCESEEDKVGKEIVDALLKGIEDNRDDLIVILAGYENDMEKFLSINPGLKSRFPNIIHFEDYTPYEMYAIALNIAKSKGYKIADNVEDDLIDLFAKNQISGKNDLGNARFVRNIIENAIMDASRKYLQDKQKKIDLLEAHNFNFKVKAKFNLEERLNDIIGLEEVKNLLRSQYKLIVAQEKRKSVGVETKIEQNLNMVFAGNPGTGKTSIARLVAEMLNSMGLLKIGQLVETDRSNFVSEIPGQTSKKTEETFKEAIGGILFIDEAYTLAYDPLGREAIETLLKLIEDYSKDVIVILAGYEKEMEDFFDVNIGLRSRFPLWTNFEDYKPDELSEMAIKLLESKGFKLSKNGYTSLKKSFVDIYENADIQSGNGRLVRNYVENLIRSQSIRIAESDISVYEMNLITTKDIDNINEFTSANDFNLEEKLKKIAANERAKDFLRNQYKIIKTKEKREKLGIKSQLSKYSNMVFTGNSGTGKKTTLKILSSMYYNVGLIKSKNIVEMDEIEITSLLDGGVQIEDILKDYLGKMVLIDKAHLFIDKYNKNEMISSLIKFIDKNNNKIIIVLCGEKEGMRELVLSNPSLSCRFPIWLDFQDYNKDELFEIAINLINYRGYEINQDGEEELRKSIVDLSNISDLSVKNALMITKFLDKVVRIQSIRVYNDKIIGKNINLINEIDIRKSKEQFVKENLMKESVHNIKYDDNNVFDETSYSESKLYYKRNINSIDELLKLKNLLDLKLINKDEFNLLKEDLLKN
ncbi:MULTISPECIES: AAA family ATPase [Terrisporobacter]|uniref:AAA family ATPase n=2 Tax=Terrisporobacter TaxID=1505652 RepID=A0A9X2MDH0_9FIRM|nr:MULTISPECIES: AAA family ATPase [Terrisporobacter]MCR1824585.1 AAA family ATPase [Terrisporobacter muris]MDY3372530.1 AAA family ATPase [Terrisporobacter othiniensis]